MKPFQFCPQCAAPLADTEIESQARRACSAECGFVDYQNPTPVVAAIVQVGDDVILVRNKGWPGKWFGLVSGFLECKEDPAEAVLREVEEELNLAAEIVELVGVHGFEQMNQVLITYHVRATGEPVAGPELEAIKAIPIAKLRAWPMGTGKALAEWLERVRD